MAALTLGLMVDHPLNSGDYPRWVKCLAGSVSAFGAIEKAISTGWKLGDPLRSEIWLSDRCSRSIGMDAKFTQAPKSQVSVRCSDVDTEDLANVEASKL